MRIKAGSRIRSKEGYLWRVTHLDQESGLVELENKEGVRFHIPKAHLKHHGKKISFLSRLFKKALK